MLTIDNGTLLAEGLEVDCNGADYAYYEHNSSLVVDSSLSCSGGYGVYVAGGEVQLIRSRVEASLAVYGEDNDDTRNERMWLYNSVLVGSQTAVQAKYMHVKADHSVFWGSRVGIDLSRAHIDSYVTNSVGVGSSCGIRTDGESALFGWNSLENNNNSCAPDAYGTVGGDPGFENAPDDMHLSASSPLRDAGDPDHDQDDDDGTRSDIGAYGGPEAD